MFGARTKTTSSSCWRARDQGRHLARTLPQVWRYAERSSKHSGSSRRRCCPPISARPSGRSSWRASTCAVPASAHGAATLRRSSSTRPSSATDSGRRPQVLGQRDGPRTWRKSISWVQRLRDAYTFASKSSLSTSTLMRLTKLAATHFSTLEEISKATTIGSQLRDYTNSAFDGLRADVFEMVRNDVFKEYRDARFLKDFHDDPDKWAQLKTGEKHIASRLANEVKTNASSIKAKIAALGSPGAARHRQGRHRASARTTSRPATRGGRNPEAAQPRHPPVPHRLDGRLEGTERGQLGRRALGPPGRSQPR